MTERKASLNSSPFLMRQVIKRGQTNAYYYYLDFGPKFSKHWICIRKSVKTERFYQHPQHKNQRKENSYVKTKKRN